MKSSFRNYYWCTSPPASCTASSRSGEGIPNSPTYDILHLLSPSHYRALLFSFHTPLPSDRLEKGAHLSYIMATDGAPDQNGVVVRTFQAVPARVLAVHKEAGAEPYYSVEISGPLSSAPQSTGSRELQTEWHK